MQLYYYVQILHFPFSILRLLRDISNRSNERTNSQAEIRCWSSLARDQQCQWHFRAVSDAFAENFIRGESLSLSLEGRVIRMTISGPNVLLFQRIIVTRAQNHYAGTVSADTSTFHLHTATDGRVNI